MKTIITMRTDLAEDGLSVPASRTFEDYDTQVDVVYITAQELEGATYGDDPEDSDSHPFCYVELKDGRSLYFLSVDLDFEYEGNKMEREIKALDIKKETITTLKLSVTWSDGRVEGLTTHLPEYILLELKSYCRDLEDLREEHDNDMRDEPYNFSPEGEITL